MMKNKNETSYQLGCSGFHYPEWKGIFYPPNVPKTKWFEYYTEHFDTVELNVTFYRTMKQEFFQKLYQKSPAHFRFSVKAPRMVTHYKKFNGCKLLLHEFYASVQEGLKDKLGCILFQLPPSYAYSADQLQLIIDNLEPGFRNVIEFRHITWWNNEVYSQLNKHSTCFCTVSYPGLPGNLISNGPLIYCRLHGVPQLYYSSYPEMFLRELTQQLIAINASEVYIYFDNTASGAAFINAKEMSSMLKTAS